MCVVFANITLEFKFCDFRRRQFRFYLKAVIIFGSWARGDQTSESDLDVLVVLDSKIKITRKLYTEWEEFNFKDVSLPDNLSIHFSQVPSQSLSGFWCEIASDGIVIFDVGLQVSRFLINLREKILSGQYSARFSHGHRYWIERDIV